MAAALKLEEDPRAARNDELVADTGKRIEAIGRAIGKTNELDQSDKRKALDALRRQLDLELQRVDLASDLAWELSQ